MCGSHRTGRSTELQMGGADFRIVRERTRDATSSARPTVHPTNLARPPEQRPQATGQPLRLSTTCVMVPRSRRSGRPGRTARCLAATGPLLGREVWRQHLGPFRDGARPDYPAAHRLAPYELKTYRVRGRLLARMIEGDED